MEEGSTIDSSNENLIWTVRSESNLASVKETKEFSLLFYLHGGFHKSIIVPSDTTISILKEELNKKEPSYFPKSLQEYSFLSHTSYEELYLLLN